MKNLLLSAICIVSLFLSSCQNWIDVNPKTDIEAEEFFTSEDGFKSALTGLYSMMAVSYTHLDVYKRQGTTWRSSLRMKKARRRFTPG